MIHAPAATARTVDMLSRPDPKPDGNSPRRNPRSMPSTAPNPSSTPVGSNSRSSALSPGATVDRGMLNSTRPCASHTPSAASVPAMQASMIQRRAGRRAMPPLCHRAGTSPHTIHEREN